MKHLYVEAGTNAALAVEGFPSKVISVGIAEQFFGIRRLCVKEGKNEICSS